MKILRNFDACVVKSSDFLCLSEIYTFKILFSQYNKQNFIAFQMFYDFCFCCNVCFKFFPNKFTAYIATKAKIWDSSWTKRCNRVRPIYRKILLNFCEHVSRFFMIGGREATCENWKWILLYLTEVHQWEYLFFLEFSDQADLSVGSCCNICHCCICLFALMDLKGLPDNIGLFAIKSISYIYTFQILVTKWVLRFKWRLLWLYFQTLSFSFSMMNSYDRWWWKTWWVSIF